MKKIITLITLFVLCSCAAQTKVQKENIHQIIDQWHQAAATANFDHYFSLMTTDAVFIGTEATENWNRKEFEEFSKPYFDRGKAWSFTSLQRNLYHSNEVYYFDELLDTQMGICRGSGIIKKEEGVYKIAHYVLSIAVPNEHVSALTKMKSDWDTTYISKLKQQ